MNELETVHNALERSAQGSLQKHLESRHRFLLLDCSGSMNDRTSDGTTKISALRELVRTIKSEQCIQFRQIVFGADVEQREDIPDAAGGTPLAQAITHAQSCGASHIVIISDGLPDSPEEALKRVVEFGKRVDVFYVGPTPHPGEEFLKKLADTVNGRFTTGDLGPGIKALTGQIERALLALPPAIELGNGT